LNDQLMETNFLAFMLGENQGNHSAVGQSILNRFVYSVDAERKELTLIERVPPPAPVTKPARK